MAEAKNRLCVEDAKNMLASGKLHKFHERGGRNLPATTFKIAKGAPLEVISFVIKGEKHEHLGVISDRGLIDPGCFFRYTCSEPDKDNAHLELMYPDVVDALGGEKNAIAINMAETGGILKVEGAQIPYYTHYRNSEELPNGRVRIAGKCYSTITWTPLE